MNGLMTLLLSDGESEEGITAYELRRVFDTIPGKKVLLLDACHSGAMIGKGVEKSFENLFAGDNYYVVCSAARRKAGTGRVKSAASGWQARGTSPAHWRMRSPARAASARMRTATVPSP